MCGQSCCQTQPSLPKHDTHENKLGSLPEFVDPTKSWIKMDLRNYMELPKPSMYGVVTSMAGVMFMG